MTTAIPTPAPKNLQARSTVNILNTVRWAVVGFFGLDALIGAIVTLVMLVQGEVTSALLALLTVGLLSIIGALFYAIVGWYVDTLDLLQKIARRIAA